MGTLQFAATLAPPLVRHQRTEKDNQLCRGGEESKRQGCTGFHLYVTMSLQWDAPLVLCAGLDTSTRQAAEQLSLANIIIKSAAPTPELAASGTSLPSPDQTVRFAGIFPPHTVQQEEMMQFFAVGYLGRSSLNNNGGWSGQQRPVQVCQLRKARAAGPAHCLSLYLAKRYNTLCSGRCCPCNAVECGRAGHRWRPAAQLCLAALHEDVHRCIHEGCAAAQHMASTWHYVADIRGAPYYVCWSPRGSTAQHVTLYQLDAWAAPGGGRRIAHENHESHNRLAQASSAASMRLHGPGPGATRTGIGLAHTRTRTSSLTNIRPQGSLSSIGMQEEMADHHPAALHDLAAAPAVPGATLGVPFTHAATHPVHAAQHSSGMQPAPALQAPPPKRVRSLQAPGPSPAGAEAGSTAHGAAQLQQEGMQAWQLPAGPPWPDDVSSMHAGGMPQLAAPHAHMRARQGAYASRLQGALVPMPAATAADAAAWSGVSHISCVPAPAPMLPPPAWPPDPHMLAVPPHALRVSAAGAGSMAAAAHASSSSSSSLPSLASAHASGARGGQVPASQQPQALLGQWPGHAHAPELPLLLDPDPDPDPGLQLPELHVLEQLLHEQPCLPGCSCMFCV